MSSTTTLSQNPIEQIAPAASKTSTITLHKLCRNCVEFFRQWEPLQSFQQTVETRCRDLAYSSLLCTVAQLGDAQEHCHFCTMLLTSLDRWPFADRQDIVDMNVWLHCRDRKEGGILLDALFAKDQPKIAAEGLTFALFGLETYQESERQGFHEHFTARQSPVFPQQNLSRARNWIKTCLEEHAACADFHSNTADETQRPTRILDVGGVGQAVKLKCDMKCAQYEYLALSHMWGKDHQNQIRLVQSRLAEFTINVPWNELSHIYREAIHITRELGYRYLWIDSLCIIQDSVSDWNHEARRMANVYGNCVCNIAYLFPPGSNQPTRADPRVWSPCILRTQTATESGVYARHLVDSWSRAFPEEEQDWLVQRNWPLFSRAWTFQEYLLSPRTLLYGHKNLMFQCSELFYDELLGPIASTCNMTQKVRGKALDKSRYFPSMLTRLEIRSGVQLSSSSALGFVFDWMSVVDEYRTRTLSYPSDRVIAFAGIAASYQKILSLTYLAGLWWEYMPLCLLWFVERKSAALVRNQYPEFRRGEDVEYTTEILEQSVESAPSWSWFRTPIWKLWNISLVFNDDEPAAKRRSEREPGQSSFEHVYWARTVAYKFEGHEEDGCQRLNRFVDFASLRVTLDALIWPVSRDLPADLALQFRTMQCSNNLDKDLQWNPRFIYHSDSPTTLDEPSPPRSGIFALITEFQIVRTAGNYNIQRRLAGLVLIPAKQEGTWRRVGVWYLKIRIKGIAVDIGQGESVAKRWQKYCLTSSWRAETLSLV